MERVSRVHFKGLEAIELIGPNGKDKVAVTLHGAHICSWTKDTHEVLFLSDEAVFSPPKAIRGGIPIVFPQFGGRGSLAAHGFARNSLWTLVEETTNERSTSITLRLPPNESFHAWTKADFSLTYKITLSDALTLELCVTNNDPNESIEFQIALHTYFNVKAIQEVKIYGMSQLTYEDNMKKPIETFVDNESVLRFAAETDRVYQNVPSVITVEDSQSRLVLTSDRFTDMVVWNPWIDKAKSLADFGDDEWHRMVCLEPANIATKAVVAPKQSKTFTHKINYARL